MCVNNGSNLYTQPISLLRQTRPNSIPLPLWILPIYPAWQHKTTPIKFSLFVDDLWLKYVNKEDGKNLLDSMESK